MQVRWTVGQEHPQGEVISTIGGFDAKGAPLRTLLLVRVGDRLQHVPFDTVTVVVQTVAEGIAPAVKETPKTQILRTNSPTLIGSDVLHFDSIPAWMRKGMEIHDLGTDGTVIPRGAVVKSFDTAARTVTMSEPVTEPPPDPVQIPSVTFGPILAGDEIGFVDHGN